MSEWRDFKTDPPPPQERVVMLVWIPKYSNNPLIGIFRNGKVLGGDWGLEDYTDVVTHWMPLPEPPEVRP